MRTLEQIDESYKAKRFECAAPNLMPHDIAKKRLELSYIVAEASDWIAGLEYEVSAAKIKEERVFLENKAKGLSIAEARSIAKIEAFEDMWKAELNYTKARRIISGGSELLNAMSSKLKVAELESRNQM